MSVQLRVQRPTRVLTKPGRDDPRDVDDRDLPADPVTGVRMSLDPTLQRHHRGVMRRDHFTAHVAVAEREQHRHRLRRRRRHIEPAHRLLTEPPAEITIRATRILARHQRQERTIVDLAGQAELIRGSAEPHPAWLARIQVVVRQLLHVIATRVHTLQRRHPNRHRRPPRDRVPVHSSVQESLSGRAVAVEDMWSTRRTGSTAAQHETNGGHEDQSRETSTSTTRLATRSLPSSVRWSGSAT